MTQAILHDITDQIDVALDSLSEESIGLISMLQYASSPGTGQENTLMIIEYFLGVDDFETYLTDFLNADQVPVD